MFLKKLKSILGLCGHKGCFRRAVVDIKIPIINHEGCLCEKHYDEILSNVQDEEIKEALKF